MTVTDAPLQEQDLRDDLTLALHELEDLRESLAELEREDMGWAKIGQGGPEFTVDQRKGIAKRLRLLAVANPLIRRAINLRIFYVWGEGVDISARAAGGDVQDVNAVVQAFLDDPGNRRVLVGEQAREEKERQLACTGNIFLALFTAPRTGRVQVRDVPADEVVDIITNPDDATDVWFYKRVWTRSEIDAGSGQTSSKTVTTYYPDWRHRPRTRTLRVSGEPVMWDAPVMHLAVNRPEGGKFGIPDAYAASFFAAAYKTFLEDWGKLVKALSRYAFRATTPGRSRAQLRSAVAGDGEAGATAVMSPGVTLEAIPKTGATIDSDSGRPTAAMVASGLDVPVTMLLGDPGTTGARATAETLDRPTELMAIMRRGLWASWLRDLLGYVVDQAARAPGGVLRGTAGRDEFGREVVTLAGDTDRGIEISWPDLTEYDLQKLVAAIVAADQTEKLPPLVVVRLLLAALGVRDVDEVIADVTDDDGNFVPPSTSAGDVAVQRFRRGEDPAGAVGDAED